MDETPIYGRNGVSLDDLWEDEPGAYMSICPPQMPNLFLFVGPNGAPGAGSTIHMSECVCDYMVKCVQKMQKENIRTMMAKSDSLTPSASDHTTDIVLEQRHGGQGIHEAGRSVFRQNDLCVHGTRI